jgi:hypothetical protein
MSAMTSSPTKSVPAPKTSPMTSPVLRRMSSDGGLTTTDAGESKEQLGHYWLTDKWHTGHHSSGIAIRLQNPKNNAVRGALQKMQRGIDANRDTAVYLMEGIRKWCNEQKRSVGVDTEEEFVKYVWHHMRQKQRDNAAAVEARCLQIGLEQARGQLKDHYAEFPDERRTDDELVALFRKLGHWSTVVSSEQRRVASKKRHEKEERLIHEKFCGDRGAYNRWKALNEQVSHGRIRDVSPQLLVKFAQWFEEHPDYLYPGSKDTSVSSAEHVVRDPLTYQYDTHRGYHNIALHNADVSKEHMLSAITGLMDGMTSARIEVTLKFDRSPNEFTMTDKYPLMNMHGCQRLISGTKHVIVAVNDDKLVFEKTHTMIKRLPDEFHNQLKGHCEREGLFKEIVCHKVFLYTPGLISSATISGQTASRENYKICLRLTERAGKTFDFASVQKAKKAAFIDSLKQEAVTKRAPRAPKPTKKERRMQQDRRRMAATPQNSPSSDFVSNLMNLKIMHDAGDLTDDEFKTAKRTLFK